MNYGEIATEVFLDIVFDAVTSEPFVLLENDAQLGGTLLRHDFVEHSCVCTETLLSRLEKLLSIYNYYYVHQSALNVTLGKNLQNRSTPTDILKP